MLKPENLNIKFCSNRKLAKTKSTSTQSLYYFVNNLVIQLNEIMKS